MFLCFLIRIFALDSTNHDAFEQVVRKKYWIMENIYKLALRCKSISDEKMGTDKNLIPYRNILFTDYTVKGAVDEYMSAID